jgi:hypothetical protein
MKYAERLLAGSQSAGSKCHRGIPSYSMFIRTLELENFSNSLMHNHGKSQVLAVVLG